MRFSSGKSVSTKVSRSHEQAIARHSSGFEQFCSMIQYADNLSILDMSGASQANISFLTSYGHKISSDDAVGTMQQCFGTDFYVNQQAASNAHRFLEQTLTFPDQSFDGALVWDVLQLLVSPLLEDVIRKLFRVMRPGSPILGFFNAQEKTNQVPVYSYRIQDAKTLLQTTRGAPQHCEYFNNRRLERLFEHSSSVKFFLTRGAQREVIVRR